MDKYSNSYASKSSLDVSKTETEKPRKEVTKVTSGKVSLKKKTVGDKIKGLFFTTDARSVFSDLVTDILVPAFKKTVAQMIRDGADMMIFGEVRNSGRSSDPDYREYYRGRGRRDDYYRDRDYDDRDRRRMRANVADFEDPEFETRGDAELVLSELRSIIKEYGMVSICDYYSASGISQIPHTYNKYGWYSLNNVDVRRSGSYYVIAMPKPELLD